MKKSQHALFGSLAAILILLAGCCSPGKNTDDAAAIKSADLSYSDLSREKGMHAAFLSMFSDSGVLLRQNHLPIAGYQAIREYLEQEPDTSFTLTWEPMDAKASGNLGYSYGLYRLTSKDGSKQFGEGTYVTIWKKDKSGNWKAVLDTGNSGLKPKDESSR